MSEDQDESQKTEEPTHKRLEDARKKGQIVRSREVNSLFILMVFGLIVTVFAPPLMRQTMEILLPFLSHPEELSVDAGGLQRLTMHLVVEIGAIIALPGLLAILAALGAGFLQTRFNTSWEPIKPKLEKISPLKGLKRMFSMNALMEFIKGIIKITIVGVVATIAITPYIDFLPRLPSEDIWDILNFLLTLVTRMIIGVLIVMFVIAILDYMYQRYEFMKKLRMSKQEIKDEYKQQEGDPHIKQKLKQIRMERARGRMMAAVPEADVVITNPTHYAVALKYDPATMRAPLLIAKGTDIAAQRIKEIAYEHKIPVMRNPVLARAIYADVEVDMAIPQQHYLAVAKIISYVYKLKGKSMSAFDLGKKAQKAQKAAIASGMLDMNKKKKKKEKAKPRRRPGEQA